MQLIESALSPIAAGVAALLQRSARARRAGPAPAARAVLPLPGLADLSNQRLGAGCRRRTELRRRRPAQPLTNRPQ